MSHFTSTIFFAVHSPHVHEFLYADVWLLLVPLKHYHFFIQWQFLYPWNHPEHQHAIRISFLIKTIVAFYFNNFLCCTQSSCSRVSLYRWHSTIRLFQVSCRPRLHQDTFPPETSWKGEYREQSMQKVTINKNAMARPIVIVTAARVVLKICRISAIFTSVNIFEQ